MKKYFLLLFILPILCLSSFTQDFISPVTLDWDTHFKGKADKKSPYLALTAMTWHYQYDAVLSKNQVKIKLTNRVSIDIDRSWAKWDKLKDQNLRDHLLHHEQGHANIEYILLKEADRVLKNRSYSVKNYKTEIATLANEIGSYFDVMQKNYDEETVHGSNHKMQEKWDKIIADKMNEVN